MNTSLHRISCFLDESNIIIESERYDKNSKKAYQVQDQKKGIKKNLIMVKKIKKGIEDLGIRKMTINSIFSKSSESKKPRVVKNSSKSLISKDIKISKYNLEENQLNINMNKSILLENIAQIRLSWQSVKSQLMVEKNSRLELKHLRSKRLKKKQEHMDLMTNQSNTNRKSYINQFLSDISSIQVLNDKNTSYNYTNSTNNKNIEAQTIEESTAFKDKNSRDSISIKSSICRLEAVNAQAAANILQSSIKLSLSLLNSPKISSIQKRNMEDRIYRAVALLNE